MAQIPIHLNHLFWDVRVDSFDPFKYPAYAISRILELGDESDVGWMRQNFSEDEIKRVLMSSRSLSRRSANFWSLIYGIPRHEIAALERRDRSRTS